MSELESEIKRLKSIIKQRDDSLAEKNRQLDALQYVWCSGGCNSGVHRYTDEEVTADIVGKAIRNTDRLVQWYINHDGRKSYTYGPDGSLDMEKLQSVWNRAREQLLQKSGLDKGSSPSRSTILAAIVEALGEYEFNAMVCGDRSVIKLSKENVEQIVLDVLKFELEIPEEGLTIGG